MELNWHTLDALKEADYMESHLDEYKCYDNIDEMFEEILSEEPATTEEA